MSSGPHGPIFHTHTYTHTHLRLWWENFLSPTGPNSENFFCRFIHFMKFPAFLVQVWFFTHPPPPPPQTLMRKFSKSKWAKQWKKCFQWIYPFHEISCIFGSGVIFQTHTPHHHLKLWWENFLSPNGPNSEKNFFSGFIHFMKFPAFLVQVWFFTHTHTHPHLKLWQENFLSPNGPNSEKKFVDLSISLNFLHFWFRCDFWLIWHTCQWVYAIMICLSCVIVIIIIIGVIICVQLSQRQHCS